MEDGLKLEKTLVANCLECLKHLDLTWHFPTQNCGFCEFTTSVREGVIRCQLFSAPPSASM